MYLIVGLGNPGKEYEITKHNAGYMAIDYVAKKLNEKINKEKFSGMYCKTTIEGEQVILLKPITYMNLSGNSVVQFLNYFNIPISNLIVIFDDVDIQMGKMRIKEKGSAGTHNGMKSIINSIGSTEFARIKIGIDNGQDINLIDYVLSNFTKEQLKELENVYKNVYDSIIDILGGKIDKAMNKYN